jgi:hypothetical protein
MRPQHQAMLLKLAGVVPQLRCASQCGCYRVPTMFVRFPTDQEHAAGDVAGGPARRRSRAGRRPLPRDLIIVVDDRRGRRSEAAEAVMNLDDLIRRLESGETSLAFDQERFHGRSGSKAGRSCRPIHGRACFSVRDTEAVAGQARCCSKLIRVMRRMLLARLLLTASPALGDVPPFC